MNHENVIGFIGQRREQNIQYVFLEYAAGGELFDRIGDHVFFLIYILIRHPDIVPPENIASTTLFLSIISVEFLIPRYKK